MGYRSRLYAFWFDRDRIAIAWLALSAPALYFFQTTIHEGEHVMAAFAVTGRFPEVAPFPHRDVFGHFYNGVTFTGIGFPAAPQFLDLALIAALTAVFTSTRIASPMIRFALRAWFLALSIDFLYNTWRGLFAGFNERADWSKFMLESGIGPVPFAVMTWIFWLGLSSHFLWVYWSRWSRELSRKADFWDYRPIAMLLGILSTVAALLSILVGDPWIDKGSAPFIAVLTVQIGASCWYWIYIGLTFKHRREWAGTGHHRPCCGR